MSLASICQPSFSAALRARGDTYFKAGLVEISSVDGGVATARVHGTGSRPYRVRIESFQGDDTSGYLVACDCPYADGSRFCKHAWALILQLDANGLGDLNGPWPADGAASADTRDAAPVSTGVREAREMREMRKTREPRRNAPAKSNGRAGRDRAPKGPDWRSLFATRSSGWGMEEHLMHSPEPDRSFGNGARPAQRELWCSLRVDASRRSGALIIGFHQRELGKRGAFGRLKTLEVTRESLHELLHPEDREILQHLFACRVRDDYDDYMRFPYRSARIEPLAYDLMLPRLCATGRFFLEAPEPEPHRSRRGAKRAGAAPEAKRAALAWDGGAPWRFFLRLAADENLGLRLEGQLARSKAGAESEETLALTQVDVLLPSCRILIRDGRLAPLDPGGSSRWISRLARSGPRAVSPDEVDEFLSAACAVPGAPPLELPPELGWRIETTPPRGRLAIHAERIGERFCRADALAEYDSHTVRLEDPCSGIVDREGRRILSRDFDAERELRLRLDRLNVLAAPMRGVSKGDRQVKPASIPELVRTLLAEGWHVEAEKIPIRSGGRFRLSVSSGIDWFDLDGALDFDGASAAIPEILAAVRKGNPWVQLDDGSRGLIPEDWLARFGAVVELGQRNDKRVRFRASQAVLLDALLAAEREVQFDPGFTQIRERLQSFRGIEAVDAPEGFRGSLREYQKTGLGWLGFLRRFGFGGCLADDMGLGKTIQVLAHLEATRRETTRPSLVVAPRSLVHNWIEEAQRFTPALRVLDHTGTDRECTEARFQEHDLAITTYGTLRRDTLHLREIPFDTVILDEAQAIKNSGALTARAARLLRADHRLALTGTPIENRIEELWSIFEFLNPGMLGTSRVFQRFAGDPEVLSRALRPFLLRRTKAAVLSELPAKMEQTLLCELSRTELSRYNELRDHYRAILQSRIRDVGWAKAKIHVLESLLRLRQAACHPGLLDPKRAGEPSAKLDALLAQVREVVAEGHKALVFSQFTKFLGIVRRQLDAEGIPYEYLDGSTRDRGARVHRFQGDADCRLFLISLKAGGHGLNLTAADYVFLLDPWWNPAVEAQAIDRAHRIGQSRRVFAYRLVARDTIEEKILLLQDAKRSLSEAILTENEAMLRKMTVEDLELLFGA